MKHRRYTGKISIKWSIFGYLLIFILILLVILWVMQTIYLDRFYKKSREKELQRAVVKMIDSINETDYKEQMNDIANAYDIRIILADSSGERIYTAGNAATEAISRLDKEQIKRLYEMALENDGEVKISSKKGLLDKPDRKPENSWEAESMENMEAPLNIHKRDEVEKMFDIPENSRMETMLTAKIITNKQKQEYFIIADSIITPVTATVQTIKQQFVYISLIMVGLSLIMAILLSFHISKPIIKISNTAKKISEGDYNIEFDNSGYKEISEMSDTLNYTLNELTKSELWQRELIANVSHDLRTPLTMITAYAEIMRDLPGENTQENIQVIIDEAKRLTNLVNDLLDISKLQAGADSANMKEYNLTAGIKSVMERYAKLVEQNGYRIVFEYEEAEVWVEADEFKIYQVLYNLVNNAVNYTGADKRVTVRQIVNGGIVRIEVEDTGEGIPKEQIDNVWDRYYKIDKTHKRAVMGTGIGLSIVKNILKLHDAHYGVKSVPGQGSIFWFELKKKNRKFTV